jgi:threonine synthase
MTIAASRSFDWRDFSFVPTGHFGDILAGYVAERICLPVGRLVIATNKNDIVARTLNEGVYAHSMYGVAIIFETGPANQQVNGTT